MTARHVSGPSNYRREETADCRPSHSPKGYIALAALIFDKWRPYPALGACLMVRLLDAIAIRFQGVRVAGIGEVLVETAHELDGLATRRYHLAVPTHS